MASCGSTSVTRLFHRLKCVSFGTQLLQAKYVKPHQVASSTVLETKEEHACVSSFFSQMNNFSSRVTKYLRDSNPIKKNVTKFSGNIYQPVILSNKLTLPLPGLEYICPSSLSFSEKVILDVDYNSQQLYDCPTTLSFGIDKILPTSKNKITSEKNISDSVDRPAIIASNKLKIRRKKMKRHHLRKFRKRNKFSLAKRRKQKRTKKEEKLKKTCDAIIQRSVAFDAEEFIKENLQKARKAGYRVNIFEKSN